MRIFSIVLVLLFAAGCSGNLGVHYESDPSPQPSEETTPEVAHHKDLHVLRTIGGTSE